jgi:hypothetical protein
MRALSTLLFLTTFSLSCAVFAGLGEKIDSLPKDMKVMGLKEKAVAKSRSTSARFQIHELSQGALSVKEYVRPDGTIFAVTWKGNTQPDLSALLGVYVDDYQEALKNRKPRKGFRWAATTQGKNVIVETSGIMRAMRGRAYVPALLPSGVSVNDLQ